MSRKLNPASSDALYVEQVWVTWCNALHKSCERLRIVFGPLVHRVPCTSSELAPFVDVVSVNLQQTHRTCFSIPATNPSHIAAAWLC